MEDLQNGPDFTIAINVSVGLQRAVLQLDDPGPVCRPVHREAADAAPTAIAECEAASPTPGQVTITIVLDAGMLRVEATGSRAKHTLGVGAFEDRISKETVPREVTSIPKLPITIVP